MDEKCRCLISQNMWDFFQTVMEGTRQRPRREDRAKTCAGLGSSLRPSAEDC